MRDDQLDLTRTRPAPARPTTERRHDMRDDQLDLTIHRADAYSLIDPPDNGPQPTAIASASTAPTAPHTAITRAGAWC